MVYFKIYWLHVVLEIDLFAQEDALFDMFRLKLCFVQAQSTPYTQGPCRIRVEAGGFLIEMIHQAYPI